MTRFFDASVIVASYARQTNTALSRKLLGEPEVAVSRLSEVETISALARLARELGTSNEDRDAGIAAFLEDYAGWYIVEVTTNITERARGLLLRHALRAGDAIQLASALMVHMQAPRGAPFVSYDRRLADAARRERLTVIDG